MLSANHPQLPARLGKRGDRQVDLLGRVTGRHLDADARLAVRHDGKAEADDVDTLFQQAIGQCEASAASPIITGRMG